MKAIKVQFPFLLQAQNCLPWDMFRPDGLSQAPVCTTFQVGPFLDTMSVKSQDCKSLCIKNCEDVLFEHFLDSSRVDPEMACESDDVVEMATQG